MIVLSDQSGRAPRCTYCAARLVYCDGRTVMPHLSWCPRRPRAAAPPAVTLLEPTPYVEPIGDADEGDDQCAVEGES